MIRPGFLLSEGLARQAASMDFFEPAPSVSFSTIPNVSTFDSEVIERRLIDLARSGYGGKPDLRAARALFVQAQGGKSIDLWEAVVKIANENPGIAEGLQRRLARANVGYLVNYFEDEVNPFFHLEGYLEEPSLVYGALHHNDAVSAQRPIVGSLRWLKVAMFLGDLGNESARQVVASFVTTPNFWETPACEGFSEIDFLSLFSVAEMGHAKKCADLLKGLRERGVIREFKAISRPLVEEARKGNAVALKKLLEFRAIPHFREVLKKNGRFLLEAVRSANPHDDRASSLAIALENFLVDHCC